MNDLPIVSFFASPPTLKYPTTDYTSADGSIDPTFLPEVWASLKKKGAQPTGPLTTLAGLPQHMMVRVASVSEIGGWLASYSVLGPKKKLNVQLVGHSRSGQLSLGGGWKTKAANWRPPYLWFDSNPHALQPLALPDIVEDVMLAGCYIAQRLSNLSAVNGRTLLFALSEMWRCRARGAVTSVNPPDFNHRGWYQGIPGGRPIGWSFKKHDTTFDGDRQARWKTEKATLGVPDKIVAGRKLIVDRALIAKFCAYFNAVLPHKQQPRAALPDLTMSLHYGKRRVPAYLLSNATCLAVGDGTERKFYTNGQRKPSLDVTAVISALSPPPQPTDARPGDGVPA